MVLTSFRPLETLLFTVHLLEFPPCTSSLTATGALLLLYRCVLNFVFVGAIVIAISILVTLLFFLILAFEEVRTDRSSFALYVTTLSKLSSRCFGNFPFNALSDFFYVRTMYTQHVVLLFPLPSTSCGYSFRTTRRHVRRVQELYYECASTC